jgi:uncharacterized protein YpuA (DUF1002 family)
MTEYNISLTENEIRVIKSNLSSVKAMAEEWMTVRDPFDSALDKFAWMVDFLDDKVAFADELAAVAVEA